MHSPEYSKNVSSAVTNIEFGKKAWGGKTTLCWLGNNFKLNLQNEKIFNHEIASQNHFKAIQTLTLFNLFTMQAKGFIDSICIEIVCWNYSNILETVVPPRDDCATSSWLNHLDKCINWVMLRKYSH